MLSWTDVNEETDTLRVAIGGTNARFQMSNITCMYFEEV